MSVHNTTSTWTKDLLQFLETPDERNILWLCDSTGSKGLVHIPHVYAHCSIKLTPLKVEDILTVAAKCPSTAYLIDFILAPPTLLQSSWHGVLSAIACLKTGYFTTTLGQVVRLPHPPQIVVLASHLPSFNMLPSVLDWILVPMQQYPEYFADVSCSRSPAAVDQTALDSSCVALPFRRVAVSNVVAGVEVNKSCVRTFGIACAKQTLVSTPCNPKPPLSPLPPKEPSRDRFKDFGSDGTQEKGATKELGKKRPRESSVLMECKPPPACPSSSLSSSSSTSSLLSPSLSTLKRVSSIVSKPPSATLPVVGMERVSSSKEETGGCGRLGGGNSRGSLQRMSDGDFLSWALSIWTEEDQGLFDAHADYCRSRYRELSGDQGDMCVNFDIVPTQESTSMPTA